MKDVAQYAVVQHVELEVVGLYAVGSGAVKEHVDASETVELVDEERAVAVEKTISLFEPGLMGGLFNKIYHFWGGMFS